MQHRIEIINHLIVEGELDAAGTELRNIFSLSTSEYLSDVNLLLAQFKKLQSDKRKGIISYEQENLTFNRIVDGLLSLVKEVKNNPTEFSGLSKIEQEIEDAGKNFNIEFPFPLKQSLINRLVRVKDLDISFHIVWVDDNPSYNRNEVKILESIGASVVQVESSQACEDELKRKGNIDLIISDVNREENPSEGFDFVKKLYHKEILVPTVFYIYHFDPEKGLPPHAFGLAVRPDELIHLVLDAVERKY